MIRGQNVPTQNSAVIIGLPSTKCPIKKCPMWECPIIKRSHHEISHFSNVPSWNFPLVTSHHETCHYKMSHQEWPLTNPSQKNADAKSPHYKTSLHLNFNVPFGTSHRMAQTVFFPKGPVACNVPLQNKLPKYCLFRQKAGFSNPKHCLESMKCNRCFQMTETYANIQRILYHFIS